MKTLKITSIKREDGLYHFDHPHNDTVEELLLNGTEEAIMVNMSEDWRNSILG